MQMITTRRAESRSISIAAPPSAVLDVVGDPLRLPEWAPRFARAVRADGDRWLVDNGTDDEFPIVVRVSRQHGTVDLLGPVDPPSGAFTRVIHNGHGSEYLFTLFFPDGTDDAAIAAQMATVEDELQTVRALSEDGQPG
jgi:uncharacterized protein YndB with AHSA1/START domain